MGSATPNSLTPIGSKLYYFKDGRPLLLKNRVIATGENITGAASGVDQESSTPMVNITLDSIVSTLFSINTTAIRWCKYFLVVFNIARPPILSKVMFTIGVLLS
jgi:preprotein translocase subunit SecD